MKKVILFLLTTFSISTLQANVHTEERAQQSALLKMNLSKGTKYIFTTSTVQSITQEIMGNKMNIDQQTTVNYLYDVLENNAQGLHIKTTYQSFAIHMQTPQGSHQFDSEASENEESPLKSLGNMVGKSFDMYVSPEGEITKVEGMKEILDAIGGDAATQQLLAQQFSDSAFMNMMNVAMNIYPNKEIKKGESWQKNASTPIAGIMEMNLQNNFILSELSNDQSTLTVQSAIALAPLSSGSALGNIEINLKGTQSGTILLHTSSGLITSSKMHQEITGDIAAQGMKIPMSILSDITLTGKAL